MAKYYCHTCAARRGLMKTLKNDNNYLTTNYQLEKFIKHTIPSDKYKYVSVFDDPNYFNYKTAIISTSGSGCLEIDDKGRINLIYVAGYRVGVTFEKGIIKYPDDAFKVVFHDNGALIHSYPETSDIVNAKRCLDCDCLIVY